jgi:ribosomal protein S18 acetylase RimI-like enzyme
VTRFIDVDEPTLLALERHETEAHALPSREIRDLGDGLLLFDPRDRDPFWNRLARVRWPSDPAGFDQRLAETMTLFGVLDRRPHVWPSPVHGRPADLVERLHANGFRDIGGGHLMVRAAPRDVSAVAPAELDRGVELRVVARAADAAPGDLGDVGVVLAEAFGAAAARAAELAADLALTLDDPRVLLVLARVDGEPAAVAKATTFDDLTYLSSIATREPFRGRGLAKLVTRHAMALAGGDSRLAYLGVWSGNAPALRVYEALGFASIGEAPDLLLE